MSDRLTYRIGLWFRPPVEPVEQYGDDTASSKPKIAVCSSGGGIRSASYNLGAMQCFAVAGPIKQVRYVTAVSGGSYIAAARAALSQAKDFAHAFRPGSPEELRLRRHTHYLLPNVRQMFRAVSSLLFGVVVNLLLVLSPLYVLMHAWGWLLARSDVVAFRGNRATGHSDLQANLWAWPAKSALTLAAVMLLLVLLDRATRAVSGDSPEAILRLAVATASAAAVLALAGVALPALLDTLSSPHAGSAPNTAQFATGTIHAGHGAVGLAAFAGGLAVLAKAAVGSVSASWSRIGEGGRKRLRSYGTRVAHFLLPWTGSALVVIGFTAAASYWTAAGAVGFPGFRAGVALGVLAVMTFLTDINRTSLHDFYRDRMESAFSDRRPGSAPRPLMSTLTTGPSLTICGSANIDAVGDLPPGRGAALFTFCSDVSGLRFASDSTGKEEDPAWTAPTVAYESLLGEDRLSLFDIVAISGAAISPVMGRLTRKAQRLLLATANIRLGVWLPHPVLVALAHDEVTERRERSDRCAPRRWWSWYTWAKTDIRRPVPTKWWSRPARWLHDATFATDLTWMQTAFKLRAHARDARAEGKSHWGWSLLAALHWRLRQSNLALLWAEAIGRNRRGQRWLYVTDGGHYDNLGLVAALRLNPDEIFVIDASGDRAHEHNTLGQAIGLARSELGVEIDIDPMDMEIQSDATAASDSKTDSTTPPWVAQPFASGTFRYTRGKVDSRPRPLHVIQLGVWDNRQLAWDVRAYARQHKTFPHDSTLQQLYDDEEFESYRALGYASMTSLLHARAASGTSCRRLGRIRARLIR